MVDLFISFQLASKLVKKINVIFVKKMAEELFRFI
jgi:ribosome-associated toxin RatA of RatAB toxin-antitoxin module